MRTPSFRIVHHVVGALVVLAWALAMGRLGASEWRKRIDAPDLRVSELLAGDGEENAGAATFGVYHGDVKVGYAASRRLRRPEGWLFVDQALWRMMLQGTPQRLVSETRALVDDRFALRSFHTRIDTGMMRIAAEGRVDGETLHVSIETAGKTFEDRQPLSGPVLLPALVRPAVAARNPSQGDSFVFAVFNPLARGVEDIQVVVEGRETIETAGGPVEAWRLSEILRGSIRSEVWIDDRGDTVREVSPIGFEIRAEPRETALSMPSDGVAPIPDLVFAVAVPVTGNLAAQVATGSVRLRLEGIDPAEFPLLDGGRQRLEGNVLAISGDGPDGGYRLPYVGGDLDRFLRPEPLVQSDDPDIVDRATRIAGEETGAAAMALALHEWVFENLNKRNSAGVPSAVEVLRERTGDCNEHTVLYVALARALGLPARMAVGLVWAEARGGGPGLYYHAWPEVYLGISGDSVFGGADSSSGWVPVDPTLGQFPANAGHIRFLVGGLEKQIDLLKLIGHLEVTVEAIEAEAPAPPRGAGPEIELEMEDEPGMEP